MDIEAKIAKNVTLRTPRLSVSCLTVLAYFFFDLTQPKCHIAGPSVRAVLGVGLRPLAC
jgi:hypothetical protein